MHLKILLNNYYFIWNNLKGFKPQTLSFYRPVQCAQSACAVHRGAFNDPKAVRVLGWEPLKNYQLLGSPLRMNLKVLMGFFDHIPLLTRMDRWIRCGRRCWNLNSFPDPPNMNPFGQLRPLITGAFHDQVIFISIKYFNFTQNIRKTNSCLGF